MKQGKFISSPFLLFCTVCFLSAGTSEIQDYWQQWVHYRMKVSLNPEEHLLTGESFITYANNSPDTLDRIYMHLYPNAFQEGSVKHREFQRVRYSGEISKDNPSYIEIGEFKIVGRDSLPSSDFKIDDTILSAYLPSLLPPGDSVTVQMTWTHKVRKRSGRMGYHRGQYDFAQWYPKMVVYDDKGWHNVPFHAIGEFYGEFGEYEVTIDVPQKYIVGATGIVVEGDPGWESVTVDTSLEFSEWVASRDTITADSADRRVVTFWAEDVHDFAWVTSPTYVYEHGEWGGIDVHVLYNTSVGERWTKVARERSERALEWLTTKFGPYPYPQVSVTHAMRGGGMEYPMLVMNGTESEGLILHEVGHIWFYGIVANNEVDEAWLDEGFTSFQTGWYLETRYPPYGIDFESTRRYSGFQKKHWSFTPSVEQSQWSALRFITSPHNTPIATKSYLSLGYSEYRYNAYTKPALMLRSLRYVLGEDVFDRGMQAYYERWKLRHTNEKRFRDAMEEASGQDLDWFFDAWLHSSFHTDYCLKKWKTKQLEDGSYEVTATIVNKGNTLFPLDIGVQLANGDEFRTRWSNHLWRWEDEFTFAVPDRPRKIILDPDNQTLDVNLLNNRSGVPRHRIVFDWPGMNYMPRDAYVVRWNPVLWYHEKDGFKPGVSLVRSYGYQSRLALSLTAGVESGQIHGKAGYSRSLRFLLPSLGFSVDAYSLEGVRGAGIDFDFNWSRFYDYPPRHSTHVGVYTTEAGDSNYTDLYDQGSVTVFYGKYGMSADAGSFGGSLNMEVSSSPGGLSDWTFARAVSELDVHGRLSGFSLAARILGGYLASDNGGVPKQEKFTIHGAGSRAYFSKPYLRHESSFYNLKLDSDDFVRNHFHLYGDANLRGYYGHAFSGAENVITATVEVSRSLPVPHLSVDARTFFDGGWVWSETDKDELAGDLLLDFGVGFALTKRLVGADLKVRMDFPFWLNHTDNPNEIEIKNVDFSRWVIGFDVGI